METLQQATTTFMAQIRAQREASKIDQQIAASAMREEIVQMKDLIGNLGFRMMGARNLVYDNEAISLRWRMGVGAKVEQVIFSYDYKSDLYSLRFINYKGDEISDDRTVDRLYVEDVRPCIERHTGFYLSLR